MSEERRTKVLFLCTGNSARSIVAEYLLRKTDGWRFETFSAGSHPRGEVHPLARRLLDEVYGIDARDARSKPWEEYKDTDFDFVITVCDNAAGETCPLWPGQPVTAHWGVPDPAAVQGADDAKRKAFLTAFTVLSTRINYLLVLPIEKLDRLALKARLDDIGTRTSAAFEADRAV